MGVQLTGRTIWRKNVGRLCCVLVCLMSVGAGRAQSSAAPEGTAREVIQLFSEEIQQAVVKMKWRGERLTEDTVYAAALTGLSWEPAWGKDHLFSMERSQREAAWEEARRNRNPRTAIIYAVSLLLEPETDPPTLHQDALRFLEQQGVDIERIMLGILQAPDRLRGLPRYVYAAADILAVRATPRLLPFLMHLVQSDDVHLRSRAILGLGILSYQKRPGESQEWSRSLVTTPLREYGLSASERKLIDREIKEAAQSDRYRLRAAAAIALSLIGDESNLPLLQKLSKDRAYTLSEPPKGVRNPPRTILYPVRMAACAGLARLGIQADSGSGEFSGKALDMAKKGGQDVTKDRSGLRREVVSQIYVSPLDAATAVPIAL